MVAKNKQSDYYGQIIVELIFHNNHSVRVKLGLSPLNYGRKTAKSQSNFLVQINDIETIHYCYALFSFSNIQFRIFSKSIPSEMLQY